MKALWAQSKFWPYFFFAIIVPPPIAICNKNTLNVGHSNKQSLQCNMLCVDGMCHSTWADSGQWLSWQADRFWALSLSQLWWRRAVSSRGSGTEYGTWMVMMAQRATLGKLGGKWTGKCAGLCCHWGEWDWEVEQLMQLLVRFRVSKSRVNVIQELRSEVWVCYWYSLITTSRQADTMSTGTWKATNTTSTSTSTESVWVTVRILLVAVLVLSQQR
jgi:hypothetical protein